jgi:hypothetical protein
LRAFRGLTAGVLAIERTDGSSSEGTPRGGVVRVTQPVVREATSLLS